MMVSKTSQKQRAGSSRQWRAQSCHD